jgi:hypothetical protein
MRLERFDVHVIVGVALVNAALMLLPMADGVLRTAVAIPAVLLCPGYSLQAALDPDRRLKHAERVLFSLGLSLVIGIAGGLLLNLTEAGLRRETWSVLLGALTVAFSAVAMMRRRHADGFALPLALPRRRDVLGFLGAVLLTFVALGISTVGAQQPRSGFSQLWLLPQDASSPLRVGVRSRELAPTAFHVRVVSGDAVMLDSSVELNSGDTWQTTLDPPPAGQSLEAFVYRDASDVPYRRVRLAPQPQQDQSQ